MNRKNMSAGQVATIAAQVESAERMVAEMKAADARDDIAAREAFRGAVRLHCDAAKSIAAKTPQEYRELLSRRARRGQTVQALEGQYDRAEGMAYTCSTPEHPFPKTVQEHRERVAHWRKVRAESLDLLTA